MHVKAKTMAFSGLLLALTVIFMVLGSVIETSTLFLLAAASFFVGIIIREFGLRIGAAFYAAGVDSVIWQTRWTAVWQTPPITAMCCGN